MRIGFFFNKIEAEIGGGFTFQDEILKALLKQSINHPEHKFFIIGESSGLHEYLIRNEHSNNLKFLFLEKYNIIERIIEWLKRSFLCFAQLIKWKGPLETLAKKNELDLVWFIGGGCFEVIDTPYVATVYDLQHRLQPWFPEVSNNGIWAEREWRHNYFLSRASYIIVGTEAGRDEVELFYQIPKFRIHKLPHPTPSFFLNSKTKNISTVLKKYNIPNNYIFYPAQFWAHKNHVNLLRAIKIINNKYGIKLPLVLTGSDMGNLKHVNDVKQETDLSSQVYILGFVPQSELYALYKNASMLAYVSLCGPENLPPLESIVAKCPVLVSNVSGSKEQLGNAALYCDPKNPNDIAEKIYELHTNDELRSKLIEIAYKRAINWTPDNFVDGLLRIVKDFENIKINWK